MAKKTQKIAPTATANEPDASQNSTAPGGDVADDAGGVSEPEAAVGQDAAPAAEAAPTAGDPKAVGNARAADKREPDPRDKRITQLEIQIDKLIRYIEFLHANHPNKLIPLKKWEENTGG